MNQQKFEQLNLSEQQEEINNNNVQKRESPHQNSNMRRSNNSNSQCQQEYDQKSELRQRSRQKYPRVIRHNNQTQSVIGIKHQKQHIIPIRNQKQKLTVGELHYDEYLQKQQQFHQNQQVLRSFLRIEQGRQQPIDKFVKILYIYKGKYDYDPKLHDIMTEPKKYLNKLTLAQLQNMLIPTKRHLTWEEKLSHQHFLSYWANLLNLIQYKITKKQQKQSQNRKQQTNESNIDLQKFQIKQKVKTMLNKSVQDLVKLSKKIEMMMKHTSFGSDATYWKNIKTKIIGKLYEHQLKKYFLEYKEKHLNQIQKRQINNQDQYQLTQPISPILQPFTTANIKNAITPEQDLQQRIKMNQNIFRDQFQKYKEKLQINLSLPKNHNLLSKDFVTQSTKTYDLITQQIMEFQKYKRMEEDEEQFDDWIPVQTEGRYRQRKPQYINRVRISHDWSRYGQSGIIKQRYDQKQPPPKQIQGYKFNIFYPDLFDKEKTPQYYLQPLEDPSHMMIKFKAGPPYKDIGFKILRKQWDFTGKSGFQAIFTKGILQLYFNFKKPKFRI